MRIWFYITHICSGNYHLFMTKILSYLLTLLNMLWLDFEYVHGIKFKAESFCGFEGNFFVFYHLGDAFKYVTKFLYMSSNQEVIHSQKTLHP